MQFARPFPAFELLAATTMLATAALFRFSDGSPVAALLPLAVLGAATVAVPELARRPARVLAVWLAVLFLLDDEQGAPFLEHHAFTEDLGNWLFINLEKLLPLPGARIRGIEIITAAFASFFLVRDLGGPGPLRFVPTGQRRIWLAGAGALMAFLVYALVLCILRGGNLTIAGTQLRVLPLFFAWTYIAFAAVRDIRDVRVMFDAFSAAMILKALQGWYVYLVAFDADLGVREYLLDHFTSFYLAVAGFYLAARWLAARRHIGHDLLLAAAGIVMIGPYVLNDRRASFAGAALALLVLLVPARRHVRWIHVKLAAAAFVGVALFVAATWNAPRPLGMLSQALSSVFVENTSDNYRDLENHNLFHEIMAAPLTGTGFGVEFRLDVPMPDISAIYPFWQSIPHNSQLLVWMAGGPFGAACLDLLLVLLAYVAGRLTRHGRSPEERLFGAVVLAAVVMWAVFVFGDMGLYEVRALILVGLLYGAAAKLSGRVQEP